MPAPPHATADQALVERILVESGVERAAGDPSIPEYFAALSQAVVRWLLARMAPLGGLFGTEVVGVVAWTLVGVILVLFMVAAVRRLGRTRPAARAPVALPVAGERGPGDLVVAPPERLRAEIEAHLDTGDAPLALKALWWWLARSLAGPEAEAAWTSRELLARARRTDLAPLARDYDRLAYGTTALDAADVRSLLTRLERALA
jgi:hypothetical protein